jgi:endonuclease YncB( thermonuclease family)
MNKFFILITVLLLLSACSGSKEISPQDIQATIPTGIQQTQRANPTSTKARMPTEPPASTPTFTATNTALPSETPTATSTPTLTATPTQTQTATITLQAIINGECLPTNTKREVGIVKSIIDGETIAVEINGTDYVVRYIGIDSPEATSDVLAGQATQKNEDLVLGKTVTLIMDTSEVDRDERLLRYVIVDGVFVNETMVRLGMVTAVSYPPDTACASTFREAQGIAEMGLLGMWAAPLLNPTARAGDSPLPTATAPPGGTSVCNCSIDYNCSDFSTHSEAQACFSSCGGSTTYNWSGMDGDHDGEPCESLP